jgi:hypothetical protein
VRDNPPLPICKPPVLVHFVGFRWISLGKDTDSERTVIEKPKQHGNLSWTVRI